ncbi:MAG: hypothetical protein K2J24_07575 [Muribaculaceae bacterium]|nr:coiled-coil domain-containing protein 22 [Bacteroides sp.]MDE6843367.1 hypothetical protein [Muribaculaceae bacterium]
MSFRLEHYIRPILYRLSRLLPLLTAAVICLVLTLCQHSKSTYNLGLEQRILSLDTESAVAASDSLDLSDERNAALAAFCRGKSAYENGNPKRATAELKMAESLIDSTELSPLSFGISHYLFYVNYYYGDTRTAQRYADRARHVAAHLKDTLKLYNAITVQAAALLEMNRKREAVDTILRILDYAHALPLRQQARMYNNIGYMFKDSDINVSRLYYEKAIACEPINAAMANLAAIYAHEGRMATADSLWSRAMLTNSNPLRLHILTDMYNTRYEIGDYKGACLAADTIIILKDKMEHERMEHDVAGEQLRFDHKWQQQRDRQHIRSLIFGIVILVLLALLTWLYYFYRRSKMEKALAKEHIMAQALQERIEGLQADIDRATEANSMQADEIRRLREQTEEVGKLNARLQSLKEKQITAYANGRRRFDEISAGSNIGSWHKRDIDDCVEYYELVDRAYMASLDTLYSGLTSKNKLFMILSYIGKSDAEIQHIFGVGPNAIRTLRSRIKAKQT